jgi:hypothetical protein
VFIIAPFSTLLLRFNGGAVLTKVPVALAFLAKQETQAVFFFFKDFHLAAM